MAVTVPVVKSKCGCCPSCEASAGSLQDEVVGADVFIGAAETVMERVATEVLNASYIVLSVMSPRARVAAHTVTTAAQPPLPINQHPHSGRNR